MKKLNFTYHLFSLIIVVSPFFVHSQSLYEVSLEQKLGNSSLIVEGKVTNQKAFWNPGHTMIFTSNTVEVYKVFKGTINKSIIEVITHGGSIGNISIEASDLLTLRPGDLGVFFCFPNKAALRSPESGELIWDVYSSSQGFFSYDLSAQTASAPFVRYPGITSSLYTELVAKTGRQFENKKSSFKVEDYAIAPNSPNAPVIVGFSPLVVDAGALLDPANNILIISGSGFGTPTGTAAVLFDDANDGAGGTPFSVLGASDPLIISWTDTEIRVRVPSRAGTGTFSVLDAGGVSGASPTPLTVIFSALTVTFVSGGTFTKESNLMNFNGTGGYSILYSNSTAGMGIDFDAAPAKATFQRALNTWKEVAGLNVTEAGTTAVQAVTGDGINLVVYDNTNAGAGVTPIAAGTLAVCYSYNSMCLPVATNEAQKVEFDIIVRNPAVSAGSTLFSEGPCPPMSSNFAEVDLETVLLHELGHALNLGHINDSHQGAFAGQLNPAKVMNFAIVNSVKRTSLDFSARLGATYEITPQGNSYGGPCGLAVSEMVPLAPISESRDECQASLFPVSTTPSNTTVTFDLVHSTSNAYNEPAYIQVRTDGVGVGVTNNAFYGFRTNSAGGIVSLSVTGYTTSPVAPATCPTPYGFPTKGIELAVYQVAACPAAQSYPTPIAYRTFNTDGALANLTGLAANTTYLLMADGIENTKANFSLTFTGSALPINLRDFTGIVQKDHNMLNWVIDYAVNVKTVSIERSADGVNFEKVGEVNHSMLTGKGNFKDFRPLTGTNYYRLATINNDDSKEYSKIVLLRRTDALLINIFPNPASQWVNVEILTQEKGKYAIIIHNSLGQAVQRKEVLVNNNRLLVSMPAEKMQNGIYHVSVYNERGDVLKNTTITIQR